MSSYKTILIIPNHAQPFDLKMVDGFSQAIQRIGINAIPLSEPVDDHLLNTLVRETNASVVLRINRPPPDITERANKFRHFSWIQDNTPDFDWCFDRLHEDDLVFTIGTRKALGVPVPDKYYGGVLTTYIDPTDFSQFEDPLSEDLDLNLVGYIPAYHCGRFIGGLNEAPSTVRVGEFNFKQWKDAFRNLVCWENQEDPLFTYQMKEQVQLESLFEKYSIEELFACYLYEPLTGILSCRETLQSLKSFYQELGLTCSTKRAGYLINEMPRFLDRYALASRTAKLNINMKFYGTNWNGFAEFADFAESPVTLEKANEIFARSRVTLQNNTHGIGIHYRTLSAMASGGLILTHGSPHDRCDGGMKHEFEDGMHYIEFNRDSYEDVLSDWLNRGADREKIKKEARRYVIEKFSWDKGAQKFLAMADLNPREIKYVYG